jgi:hypothetical protein
MAGQPDDEWDAAAADWDAVGEVGQDSRARVQKKQKRPTKPAKPELKKKREDEGGEGVSARRLKQYCGQGGGGKFLEITVGLTGARAGDVLHGCSGDTANVVLCIDTGVIAAPIIIRQSVEAEAGIEKVVASVAKHFGISNTAAALRYADCPQTDAPNHQPLGQGCTHTAGVAGPGCCGCEPAARFTILNQGVWQQFAELHGHGPELHAMVHERRSVCYRDVLQLMHTAGEPGGKLLILRPRLFSVVIGPLRISPDDPKLLEPTNAPIDGTALLLSK